MSRPKLRQVLLEQGEVDLVTRRVSRDGEVLHTLTTTEAALLELLIRRSGEAVPRAELLRDVWGYRDGVRSRTVDTTMRRLRRKIERVPGVPRHLCTEEGVGYRFVSLAQVPIGAAGQRLLDPTVGREVERKWLDRLSEQGARLISVVGPAGVGKSRLAREWLHDKRSLEVDLGRVAQAGDVMAAIARAAATNSVGLAELATRLSSRGVDWLLLDDVAHLLPHLGDLTSALARSDVRLLVTSRCVLRVPGDSRLELSPLDAAAGVQLLRLRAPVSLGDADGGILEDIVERLHGLPHALEMAASRASLLGPQGLLEHLEQPRRRLALPSPSNPQQTLRSVTRSAWDGLPAQAQGALSCLAAFRGGFTVAAAEAVLDHPDGLQLVQLLRDHSCLCRQVGGGGRRLELIAPLRDFVWEHIGVPAVSELRHARYFASWGANKATPGSGRQADSRRCRPVADWRNVLRAIEVGLSQGEPATAAGAACVAWELAPLTRSAADLIPTLVKVLVAQPRESVWRRRLLVALADLRRAEGLHQLPMAPELRLSGRQPELSPSLVGADDRGRRPGR